MDGKANLPVGHKIQPKEAIVQHAMAMNVDEEEYYNNTQELMVAPNSKEVVVASDATAVEDIVELGTHNATIQQQEQEQEEAEQMEVGDHGDDYGDDYEEEEEDDAVADAHAMQWLFLIGEAAEAPHPIEAGQGGIQYVDEEENYMGYVATMFPMQTGWNGARAFPLETRIQATEMVFPMQAEWNRARAFPLETRIQATEMAFPMQIGWNRARAFPLETRIQATDMAFPMQTGWNGARAFPLETRIQATEMAWLNAPANDHVPIRSTRQSVFNSSEPQVVFAGMEEETDNDWYDSIAHDAQMMEEMEDPGINEIATPLQLPIPEAPTEEPSAEEASPELSLQDINKMWGLHLSELDPDEPGPSTRSQLRVAPLADDEVAKFYCGICLETLPVFDLFHGMPCPHKFCAVCMDKYIKARTRAGEVPIPCPDPSCKEVGNDNILNPEDCKKSIDFDVFCAWTNLLTENAIPANQRIYCPNRECRSMLEMMESTCTNKTPSKAPCPACNRLMCVTCRMGWSTDGSGQHDCTEGPEAELVKQLATERRWKQCPQCRYYVEKTMGCNAMTCRCRAIFCYTCGRPLLETQGEGGELCQCHN